MLSEKTDNLQKQLQQFDLSSDEVTLYLGLLEHSSLTALQLSRKLKIARTKIYRILEKLLERGLVKEEVKETGKRFVAENPSKFLHIVNEKERDLLLLKATAPTLVGQLNSLQPKVMEGSKILNYRGLEGLKQVTWNTTKVKGIFRIYEYGYSMNVFLDEDFSEKVRREYIKIKTANFRQLTNLKRIDPFTNVSEHLQQWEVRHIPKAELDIQMEIMIYNDVYCMYEYANDDIFIVEIYNQKLADMQKQIFDQVWKNSKKMKIVSDQGEAVLK